MSSLLEGISIRMSSSSHLQVVCVGVLGQPLLRETVSNTLKYQCTQHFFFCLFVESSWLMCTCHTLAEKDVIHLLRIHFQACAILTDVKFQSISPIANTVGVHEVLFHPSISWGHQGGCSCSHYKVFWYMSTVHCFTGQQTPQKIAVLISELKG